MTMWYFLTLFMQNVLDYGPLQTGLGFLPHTLLTVIVGARITPHLMRYVDGRTLIAIGAAVAAAGFLWQSRIASDSGYLYGVLGLAALVAVASVSVQTPDALAAGYGRAFLTIAAILLVVAVSAFALPAKPPR